VRSRLDRGDLAFGVVFVVLGGAYLLQELGVWRVQPQLLLPALLIVAGVVVAASGLGRRSAAR
jgi:hypothetical protein